MSDEPVRYEVDGAVANLVLDSPHNRNALSARLVAGLRDGLDRAEADPDVTVVLLRAAGPVFCSGADLAEASTASMEDTARSLVALQRRVLTLAKPVVARVHGAVRAGGIGLVAAADVAVGATDATFALTEVRLGLTPAVISLTVLPRMTSRAAAEACLTATAFDGTTAASHGLLTRAVPADELDGAVAAVCGDLAKGHPQGLAETKRLLTAPLVERLDREGEAVAALSARLFASDEARAAMRAFLERRRG